MNFHRAAASLYPTFAPWVRQDKPGRSNILKGGYLVNYPFDK